MALQLYIGLLLCVLLPSHAPPSASPSASCYFGLSLVPLLALPQLSLQVVSCFNYSSTAIRQNHIQISNTADTLGGTKGQMMHLCSIWDVFANIQGLQPSVF